MAKERLGGDGAAHEGSVTGDPSNLDPRVIASRERVLATALDMLTETGLGGLTVDDLSRRSGVAKTTIYRHWPNRTAIMIDTCSRMIESAGTPPDTGRIDADLRSILTNIAELLSTARWSSIVPSVVDVAEHDPQFARILARIQRGHAAPLRVAVERATRRGEIPATADGSAIAAALLGPLFYRRWFSREPIDEQFVEMLVRGTVASFNARPSN